MTKFIERFPQLKGKDFYISGESYAGHFIPHAANYIFNKRDKNIPLKGAAIGNGLLNIWIQPEAYAEYSLLNRLITFDEYLKLLPKFRQCETMMEYGIEGGKEMSFDLIGQIITGKEGQSRTGMNWSGQRFNTYDITKPCLGSLCYNFTAVNEFLNQRKI